MASRQPSKKQAPKKPKEDLQKGDECFITDLDSNSDCEHKPCMWLLTQTEEPRRHSLYVELQQDDPTPLDQLGDAQEELARLVIWEVRKDHPPGLFEELVGNCGKGCKCWKTEPAPKEEDWPEYESVEWKSEITYQPGGSSGPRHSYKVQGTIYKRKTTISGICDSVNGTPVSPGSGSDF